MEFRLIIGFQFCTLEDCREETLVRKERFLDSENKIFLIEYETISKIRVFFFFLREIKGIFRFVATLLMNLQIYKFYTIHVIY